jgi:uncharacterized membrane protein YebE (DUF533 family)
MSDLRLDDLTHSKNITANTAGSAAGIGTVPYLLNKIWSEGWHDPDAPKQQRQEAPSIHAQAQQVHQKMIAAQQRQQNGIIRLV